MPAVDTLDHRRSQRALIWTHGRKYKGRHSGPGSKQKPLLLSDIPVLVLDLTPFPVTQTGQLLKVILRSEWLHDATVTVSDLRSEMSRTLKRGPERLTASSRLGDRFDEPQSSMDS